MARSALAFRSSDSPISKASGGERLRIAPPIEIGYPGVGMALADDLFEQARVLRAHADSIEQVARRLRGLLGEPKSGAEPSLPASPAARRPQSVRRGAKRGPRKAASYVAAAVELIKAKKRPVHMSEIQPEVNAERSRLQKTLDRAVRAGQLRKVKPATYDLPKS